MLHLLVLLAVLLILALKKSPLLRNVRKASGGHFQDALDGFTVGVESRRPVQTVLVV